MAKAQTVGMDTVVADDTGESVAERLWRRYGTAATTMVDRCAEDPTQMQPVLEGTGLRRCELMYIREREMVVCLDDLLRRRSKLSLLYSHDALRSLAGMSSLCDQLFESHGAREFADYFDAPLSVAGAGVRSA